jgi:hypothetical protein
LNSFGWPAAVGVSVEANQLSSVPMPNLQISLIKGDISGADPQNPLANITPEAWTVSR